MWWGEDVHCSLQRVGELKSTQEDTFVLSASAVLSLGRPVLSLLVILAAGFYIPLSEKNALLTPKSRAAVKGCPAHTTNSALHVQMGLTQIVSSPNQIPGSHILSRLAGEGQIHTETLWGVWWFPKTVVKVSAPELSIQSVLQGVSRMEIQGGCLWQ